MLHTMRHYRTAGQLPGEVADSGGLPPLKRERIDMSGLVRPKSESAGKTRYTSTTTFFISLADAPNGIRPVKAAPVINVFEDEIIAGLDFELSAVGLASRLPAQDSMLTVSDVVHPPAILGQHLCRDPA